MSVKVIRYSDDTYAFDEGMVRCFLLLGKERALLFDSLNDKTDLLRMA